MTLSTLLSKARSHLAQTWVLALFGSIYIVSQVVIATLVHPLGTELMVNLQVTGFSSAEYIRVFDIWQAAGTMPFYHAHLIFDDVHWIWYSLALSSFLALGLDAARLDERWNIVLMFPPLAGFQDCIENGLQHVFLSQPNYLAIIEPLPAISTTVSIGKWILFIGSYLLIIAFYLRALQLRSGRG